MAAPSTAKAAAPAEKKVRIKIWATFAKVDGVPVTRGQVVEASKPEADRLLAAHRAYYGPTGAGRLGGGNPFHGATLADEAVEVPANLSATDIPLTGGPQFANDSDDE